MKARSWRVVERRRPLGQLGSEFRESVSDFVPAQAYVCRDPVSDHRALSAEFSEEVSGSKCKLGVSSRAKAVEHHPEGRLAVAADLDLLEETLSPLLADPEDVFQDHPDCPYFSKEASANS